MVQLTTPPGNACVFSQKTLVQVRHGDRSGAKSSEYADFIRRAEAVLIVRRMRYWLLRSPSRSGDGIHHVAGCGQFADLPNLSHVSDEG